MEWRFVEFEGWISERREMEMRRREKMWDESWDMVIFLLTVEWNDGIMD